MSSSTGFRFILSLSGDITALNHCVFVFMLNSLKVISFPNSCGAHYYNSQVFHRSGEMRFANLRFDDDVSGPLGSLSWNSGERSQGWLYLHGGERRSFGVKGDC